MDGWNHPQTVDYEKISFKWKVCHEYGHFARTCPKRKQQDVEGNQEKEWNEVSREKMSNMNPNQQQSPAKRKVPKNNFHVLASEDKEEEDGEVKKNEAEEAKEVEGDPMVQEIYKEVDLFPTSLKQPYIEIRSEASQSSGGSVTMSRSKELWEETFESKEEEAEPQIKNERKLNKRLRDMEVTCEKVVGKKTSLDQHIRVITSRREPQGIIEDKKDKDIPHTPKK